MLHLVGQLLIQIVIIVLFFVEYFPEDYRKKRLKHVGGLPHVCISLFLIIVQLLEYPVFGDLKNVITIPIVNRVLVFLSLVQCAPQSAVTLGSFILLRLNWPPSSETHS